MAFDLRRFIKGLIIDKVSYDSSVHDKEGAIFEDSSDDKLKVRLGSSQRKIVTHDQAETLTNKTIDADLSTITNIKNADIKAAAAIDATKIADGSVTNSEFQFLASVTSDIQTQINAKASSSDLSNHESDTSTHGVATVAGISEAQVFTNKTIDADLNTILNIENADIKAAAAIDATKIANGSVTNAEFQYLGSVTSDLQTQLDAKASNTALSNHESDTSTHGVSTVAGLAETQSFSNKSFSDPVTVAEQGSTPSNPSAGNHKIYTKSDGKLYRLNSSGTEAEITTGVSVLDNLNDVVISAPSNGQTLVYNNGTSQWENAAPGAGTLALDDLTDVVINSPDYDKDSLLYDVDSNNWRNFKSYDRRLPNSIMNYRGYMAYYQTAHWTSSGANLSTSASAGYIRGADTQSEGISIIKDAFNINGTYIRYTPVIDVLADQGRLLQVNFDYTNTAGFVDNDFDVYIYDTTNSVEITHYHGDKYLKADTNGRKFSGLFLVPATATSAEFRIRCVTTSAAAYGIAIFHPEVIPYDSSLLPERVVTKTASATLAVTGEENVICVPASNMTLTLPTAVNNHGLKYHIKSLNTLEYTITIDANGSETIDEQLTLLLSVYGDFINIVSNGTNWIITSSNLYSSPNHNYIQNGDFNNQQYTSITSATAMTSGVFYIDRWKSQLITATGTIQHIFGGPNSLRYTLKVVATNTVTGYLNLIHTTDATKDLRGKKATLSFWYKSDMTNFKVRWGFGVSEPIMPAIPVSSVWKFYSVSYDVPSNATYVAVQLGPQNNAITSGQFYQISGVKLEMGEIPTEFESKDAWNVCAQTYPITVQSFPSGTYTTIIHDAEAEDTHGAYNNSTGIFTCPVAGRYAMTCHLILDANGLQADPPEAMYLRAHKAGARSEIKFIGDFTVGHNVAGYRLGINGSTVFNCEQGDTLFFQAQQNTGASYVTLFTGSTIANQINNCTFTLIGAPV